MQRFKAAWALRNEKRTQATALRRANAEQLIKGRCIATPSTDTHLSSPPEFLCTPRIDLHAMPGRRRWRQSKVSLLGMTPSQAIVAATKNGAIASRGLRDFGTLAAGKLGDSLILDADPIADIHSVRKLSLVMRDGRIIDRDKLPEKPVWTKRGKSDGGSGTAHRTDSGVLFPHSPSPIPHRQSPLPVGLPPHLPLTIRVALVLTTHMCDSHSLPSSKFGRPTQTARLTPAKQAARRRKPHQP